MHIGYRDREESDRDAYPKDVLHVLTSNFQFGMTSAGTAMRASDLGAESADSPELCCQECRYFLPGIALP